MDLILWRHAEAFEAAPGETDLDRALTPRGLEHAAHMAEWLRDRLPHDTRIVASPARRTQQTAEALGRPFQLLPSLRPGAHVDDVLRATGWPDADVPVMVVGHQPTLGLLASWVISGHRQHWSLKKAGVWWLRAESRGTVTLIAVQSPGLP
jgi:phosphohistidine phosphatase